MSGLSVLSIIYLGTNNGDILIILTVESFKELPRIIFSSENALIGFNTGLTRFGQILRKYRVS